MELSGYARNVVRSHQRDSTCIVGHSVQRGYRYDPANRAGVDIDGAHHDDDDQQPRRLQGARSVLSHHREGPRRHCGWWAFLRPAGRRRHLRLHHHDFRLRKAHQRPQGRRRALPSLRHHDRPRPMSRPRGPSRHQDRRRGARVRLRRPSRSDRGPVHQPVHLGTHDHRSQGHSLARLPRPRGGLRRARWPSR